MELRWWQRGEERYGVLSCAAYQTVAVWYIYRRCRIPTWSKELVIPNSAFL
jgi:hypothetical protein